MFAAAQRLAKVGGWILSVSNEVLRWTDETHRIFGLTQAEFHNFTLAAFLERVHADDRLRIEDTIRHARAAAIRFSYQYRFFAPGGRERTMRGDGESQSDANGNVFRLVGTVMDVTEQEQMRQAASLGEARLRTLTDSPFIWLWEQDEEFRFTLLSEDQQHTHRHGHVGAIGRRRWEVPDAAPIHGTWKEHQDLLQARRGFRNFQYRVSSGRSTRYLSTSGVPLFADDGCFLGTGASVMTSRR